MVTQQILTLIGDLINPNQRRVSAQKLARSLGAKELIVFILDPSLSVLLPAPGFPQSLPEGRRWQEFLAGCTAGKPCAAELPSLYDGKPTAVLGLKGVDGSVVALLGARHLESADEFYRLIPLIAAPLRAETVARAAEAQAAIMSDAAAKYAALVSKLEETRRELHRMLTLAERQQTALGEQRQWFEVTLNSIGDAVITTDVNGRVTFLNPVAENMTGWKSSDAFEQPLENVFRIINENTRQPAENPVEEILREEHVVGLANHTVLISKDGTERAIEDSAAPIRNASGSVSGIVIVFHDVTERRLTEIALRDKETRWRAMFNQAAVGMAMAGLDGRFEQVNRRFCEIVDYTPEELYQRSFISITHPDDLPLTESGVQRLVSGAISEDVTEKRYVRKDGAVVWVLTSIGLLRDADGRAQRLIAVVSDITARKQAEESSRRSEEQLWALANSIPQLVWMAEPDGHIFWYNQRWYDYTGTTFEQMQGWGWQSVHDPQILPSVLKRWQSSISTGTPFEMEFPLRGADGKFRWFLTRVIPVRDSEGRVVRWFGTNTDVDQVRQTQEVLQEETRLLELLNDTGKGIASQLDLETLVQTVTDAGTKLSGAKFGAFFYNVTNEQEETLALYTLSGAPKKAFEKFGPPRNTPIFEPTFRGEGVLRSADITKDPRYGRMPPHYGMPEGHLPVRSYLAVPVVSRSGEVVGGLFFGHPKPNVFSERIERLIVGIAAQAAIAIDNARLYEAAQREIAERKRAEQIIKAAKEEAEGANRTKDEFLAVISHELRTPLTAMLGWARMLKSGNLEASKIEHGIHVIERNAVVQTQLIEDLLDVSRIITGKLSLTMQTVDLRTPILAAIESVRVAAEAKQIQLELINESPGGTVIGDVGRLQQVFWNLLSNAIKFTQRGGRVEIQIKQADATLHVTIADNGKGIRSDFLPHIFERFRQDDSTTTRRYGGLGLGLAIVRYLVEQHGGRICVESAGEGKGSSFMVELPVQAGPPSPAGSKNSDGTRIGVGNPLAGVRVMVVENDADSRDLLMTVLSAAGALGIGVASANEALTELDRALPDAMVIDIGMPVKDGYQLIHALRSRSKSRGGSVPALALTAYAREEDRLRALKAGFDMHAPKPIDPIELVNRVVKLIDR